jgi:hypothetical protein
MTVIRSTIENNNQDQKHKEGGCKRKGDAQLHEHKKRQQQWLGTWEKVTILIKTKKVMTMIINIRKSNADD